MLAPLGSDFIADHDRQSCLTERAFDFCSDDVVSNDCEILPEQRLRRNEESTARRCARSDSLMARKLSHRPITAATMTLSSLYIRRCAWDYEKERRRSHSLCPDRVVRQGRRGTSVDTSLASGLGAFARSFAASSAVQRAWPTRGCTGGRAASAAPEDTHPAWRPTRPRQRTTLAGPVDRGALARLPTGESARLADGGLAPADDFAL